MGKPKAPCGTDAAYRRHLRNGETVDDACRDAHAAARRGDRRSPADTPRPTFVATAPETPTDESEEPEQDDLDDLALIVSGLRSAFKKIAKDDPTKLAPIAREFRAAVEAVRGPAEPPKELSLADQLEAARSARAARAARKDAPA
ncbi:hypothetical protein [Microbacterium sp. IEGM 1404]|uniref:hypothetical protein n=1 Tax=Microbacterium sp. IEGM 1404 TaxID=3047084 RepID=UPI0024B6D429|nr:hypothetical protein [Microbacterium sp. IEGM 1404]MDI9889963.1 hypothetical protein [Microbacterium sp. IEGM 1404]